MSASFIFLHFPKTFQKEQVSHILGDLIPVMGRLDLRGSSLPNAKFKLMKTWFGYKSIIYKIMNIISFICLKY